MKIEDRYLGDGVYASFDGYHINLAVNNHTNHVVALESDVLRKLITYANDIYETNMQFNADKKEQ